MTCEDASVTQDQLRIANARDNAVAWNCLEAGGVRNIDGTNVILYRRTGGDFDATDYDATSYNRGWITIWYIV